MLQRALVVVGILAVGVACTEPPPGVPALPGTSTSSSGGSGDGIPLDQLCQRVVDGYFNYYLAYSYALMPDQDCPNSVPLTEAEFFEIYDGFYRGFRENMCSDSPSADTTTAFYGMYLRGAVQAIADGEARGRVDYDAEMAKRCDDLGEAQVTAAGGRVAWVRTLFPDGGVVDAAGPTECHEFIRGLQGDGEPCSTTVECEQGERGVTCVGPFGTGCEGRCRANATEGQPCLGGTAPACVDGLQCVQDGSSEPGTCMRKVGDNGACRFDGGPNRECEDGLVCLASGICRPRLGEGTGCASNDECEAGLECRGEPRRCLPPPGEGEACENGCAPCLNCWGPEGVDAGRTCVAPAGEGQSCADAPCVFPTTCFADSCMRGNEEGQACQDERVGDTLRSNCRVGLVCAGDPPVCGVPGGPGSPCRAPPLPGAEQGTCNGGLTCVRPSATATEGTCAAPGQEGDPCGDRYDVAAACAYDYSIFITGDYRAYVQCSAQGDGSVGVCTRPYSVEEGDPCTFSCPVGLWCERPDGGEQGTCRRGAALGQPCDMTGYQCDEGYCGFSADAGFQSICMPAKGLGAECGSSSQCQADAFCRYGDGGFEGTCVAKVGAGERCGSATECQEGLTCNKGHCAELACVAQQSFASCADADSLGLFLFFGAVVARPWWRRRRDG